MSEASKSNYRLQSDNKHLKNILEENYLIELGTVDIKVLDALLNGEILDLNSCIYYDIAVEGTGKISDEKEYELDYQLTYLLQLRQKSSSHKIFLTSGIIKYFNESNIELYGPVALIPIDIDYRHGKIVKSGEVIPNMVLLNELEVLKGMTLFKPDRFTSIFQMDAYGKRIALETNSVYEIGNFLTYAKVQYPDFEFKEDFFSVERSVYETTEADILKEYFTNVRGILPTNIYQKYVLIKAHNGENFAVNGRLGSGKTYTILNIVADQVAMNKRVLYVNQDIDNISEFERNLTMLQMKPFTHNFYKVSLLLPEPNIILPKITDDDYNLDVIKPLEDYQNNLFEKIHGFTYKSIVESLAVIKYNIPDIETIPIEITLEKFEVDSIVEKLKEMEKIFTKVEPLIFGVWTKIENYYHESSAPELAQAVIQYDSAQKEFNKYLFAFCKKYYIKQPYSFHDAHRLISDVRCFCISAPPECWTDSFRLEDALQAVINLRVAQESQFELINLYKKLVTDKYVEGDAEELLDKIYYRHLTSRNSQQINAILADKTELSELLQIMKKEKDIYYNLTKKLESSFKISKVDSNVAPLFKELGSLLHNNKISKNWINKYIHEHEMMLEENAIIKEKISSIKALKERIDKYTIKTLTITYEGLKSLTNNRTFERLVEHMFNRKSLRADNLTPTDMYRVVLEYMDESSLLLKRCTAIGLEVNGDFHEFCSQYENFLDFIYALSEDNERFIFNYFNNSNLDDILKNNKLEDLLLKFTSCCDTFEDAFSKLAKYGIIPEGDDTVTKITNLDDWINYVERLLQVKSTIKEIFKNNEEITLKDMIKLVNIDRNFINLKQIMEEREDYYRDLLSDAYRGFETDCNQINVLIDHFNAFKDKVNDQKSLGKLLKKEKMAEMLKDFPKLEELSEKLTSTHRNFSRFFNEGQPYFLDCDLTKVDTYTKLFIDRIDQIAPTIRVLEYANRFKTLGLESMYHGIMDSSLELHASDRFLYSILLQYRDEFLKLHPEYNPDIDIIECMEKYNVYERNYCTSNLIDLYTKSVDNERKPKTRLSTIVFNNYNQYITQADKYRQIYLATGDIFNSDIDLGLFDLVIVDDCHLTSANKYYRMLECKQVLAFGDDSFKSTIANSLLKKIDSSSIVQFKRRYVKMSSRLNNKWSINDQYIYDYNDKIDSICLENDLSMVEYIVNYFYQNPNRIINIIISSLETKRNLYTLLVEKMSEHYSGEQIVTLLNYHIRLINCNSEGTRYASDVFFYYDDINEADIVNRDTIFKNYMAVTDQVTFIYHPGHNAEETDRKKTDIEYIIGKRVVHQKETVGIVKILYNELKKRGLKVETGFGRFDVIVRGKGNYNNLSIIVEGSDASMPFSLLDDYEYYYKEYKRVGWNVLTYTVEKLAQNLTGCIDEIVEKFYASKTSPVKQLNFDEVLIDPEEVVPQKRRKNSTKVGKK